MSLPVAVLGKGQLGWMLRQAGERLGIAVQLLTPDAVDMPAPDTLITIESEHWPDNPGTRSLQQHSGWQNAQAIAWLTDRRQQKALLDQLNLPTAPWAIPSGDSTVPELQAMLGDDFLLKRARGGYDGRGQWRAGKQPAAALPEWKCDAIAESAIPFDAEVSLVGARGRDGRCVFYRLTENLHRNGILTISISRDTGMNHLQQRAEAMLSTLLHHLDYVGVMAMECFVQGDTLLVNELAPRVHNSGHWTQDGASISQFELHLRALQGLPLPAPEQTGTTLMVNLLGMEYDPAWLQVAGARLYWYGKPYQPGRKMGHINLHHPDTGKIIGWLQQLALPADYQDSLAWALRRLAST